MDGLWTHLRYGGRALRSRPGLTATIVLSLAIGLGANAIVFAVVDGAILRPFPFPEPSRFVGVGAAYPKLNRPLGFFEVLSGPEYLDIRSVSSLTHVSAFDLGNEPVMIGDTPERVFTAFVWDDPLLALDLPPAVGRSFAADELRTAAPVAVVSHWFWQAYLGGDLRAVGESIRIGGRPHVVIGVMPERVRLYGTDLWVPMSESAATIARNRRQFNVVARLAPGVSLDAANEELALVARRIQADHGGEFAEYEGLQLAAQPWTDIEVWGFSGVTTIVFCAVGLLMLLITLNLAGLLAARSASRRGEMAVRIAIGASRGNVAAQLVTEIAMQTAAGALGGLLIAWVGVRALPSALPAGLIPDDTAIQLSPQLLLFLMALSALSALLVSVAPTWHLVGTAPAAVLNSDAGRASGGRSTRRVHTAVVALEVAAAVIVTGSATLLAVNTQRLLEVDRGFDTSNLLRTRVTLPLSKYDGATSLVFFDTLLERLRALPAVTHATVSNQPPPGVFSRSTFAIDGRPNADGNLLPTMFYSTVGSDFRETFGLRLTHGRWLNEEAPVAAPREVVINETLALRYFADADPLTRRVQVQGAANDGGWADIVGVVADVRNAGLASPPQPEMFGSVRQIPDRRRTQLYVVVRTREDPMLTLPDLRAIVRSLDDGQPVYATATVDEQYEGGVRTRQAAAGLLSAFSVLALGLACVGIFGVISYSVNERTQEIGLRVALGADGRAVRRLVMGQAMRPVCAGAAAGMATLVLGQQLLSRWLYGISPEVVPLVLVSAVVLLASALAGAFPVWRASRLSPLVALASRR